MGRNHFDILFNQEICNNIPFQYLCKNDNRKYLLKMIPVAWSEIYITRFKMRLHIFAELVYYLNMNLIGLIKFKVIPYNIYNIYQIFLESGIING